jgi:hypothetical protein
MRFKVTLGRAFTPHSAVKQWAQISRDVGLPDYSEVAWILSPQALRVLLLLDCQVPPSPPPPTPSHTHSAHFISSPSTTAVIATF